MIVTGDAQDSVIENLGLPKFLTDSLLKNNNAEDYIITLASVYGGLGQMFDYTQYKQYEADVLNNVSIKPNPREDSFIWVLGTKLKENSSENIVYIISIEGEGEAYMYLYYSRK